MRARKKWRWEKKECACSEGCTERLGFLRGRKTGLLKPMMAGTDGAFGPLGRWTRQRGRTIWPGLTNQRLQGWGSVWPGRGWWMDDGWMDGSV